MKNLHTVTFLLLVVGGVNWLLLGIFGWEVGVLFGGSGALVSKIIYIVIGLAAVYELLAHKKNCRICSSGGQPSGDAGVVGM